MAPGCIRIAFSMGPGLRIPTTSVVRNIDADWAAILGREP